MNRIAQFRTSTFGFPFYAGILLGILLIQTPSLAQDKTAETNVNRFLADVLNKKAETFGSEYVEDKNDNYQLIAGDIFQSKKTHALAFLLKPAFEIALFERNKKEWTLIDHRIFPETGKADMKKLKKTNPFALRNLSSDKAPEVLLVDGSKEDTATYTMFRYVKPDNKFQITATEIPEPFWDGDRKEVLAYTGHSVENNTVTFWRWDSGKLKPSWESNQKTVSDKFTTELIFRFYQYMDGKKVLVRRCRGTAPFYANPVGVKILGPIQQTGKMNAFLSTPDKSYNMTAYVGVMRIASFDLSLQNFLDQFSRGFFFSADSFNGHFKITMPKDGKEMPLGQLCRVRVPPVEHKKWKEPKDKEGLIQHTKNVLEGLGNDDVFALLKLVPKDSSTTIFKGISAEIKGNKTGTITANDIADALDGIPERLQTKSGKAETDITDTNAKVSLEGFPANPAGKKVHLEGNYEKKDGSWIPVSFMLKWSE